MPEDNNPSTESISTSSHNDDELVQKVSDKVYAMLIRDLTIELERNRPSSIHSMISRGSW